MESYRKTAYVVAGLILSAYAAVTLMGPQGFFSLRDKYRDIRQMERDNAELERVNQEMKGRIEKVKSSRGEREIIVRKQLKYVLPDETQFVIEGSKPDAAAPVPDDIPPVSKPRP